MISRRSFLRSSIGAGVCASLGSAFGMPSLALAQVTRAAIGVNVGYAVRQELAAANLIAFERVIGRQVDYVVEYGGQATWKESITSAAHAMRVWRGVVAESRRKLL